MAGLEDTAKISGNFSDMAGTVVLQVENMQINGNKFTFDLPNALSHADNVASAQRVVVTQDKEAFLKEQSSCAHVTISKDDLSREGYSLFSGTATIGVNNLSQTELQNAAALGCAVAEIQPDIAPLPQVALNTVNP